MNDNDNVEIERKVKDLHNFFTYGHPEPNTNQGNKTTQATSIFFNKTTLLSSFTIGPFIGNFLG